MRQLFPFISMPAYRFGPLTPWGGSRLRELYGKDCPKDHTGESLEVSALLGYESLHPDGETLTQLIARHGADLTGERGQGAFPLLLKLLDAGDRLSVQVHPDNDYAGRQEGKLGKTEAWLILSAEPGARLIYGLAPGVDAADLRRALQTMWEPGGAERVEMCFNSMDITPGQVYYIPSGTIHAIGAGIVLYEIQQSSDITYRLWDGLRRDALGQTRQLHVDHALNVIERSIARHPDRAADQPSITGVAIDDPASGCQRTIYIACEYFALERLTISGTARQAGDAGSFALLTALGGGRVEGEGFAFDVTAGQTIFVPSSSPPFTITGSLDIVKSYVPDRSLLRGELGGNAALVAGLLDD